MGSGKDACFALCKVGGRGLLLLPWGGDDEQTWNRGVRAVLYLVALGWCFLGVALIADVFMGAIEHITSQKTRKWKPELNRYVTVFVWNPTVANLTLLAVGSSTPEILLSIIELLGKDFYSGDLGPSTIVGSAAFNLFVIIAVCVMAIPDGEIRSIKELPVYFVTALCSLFAYAWLLVILQASSENVVEPWEGLLTLGFMPALVIVAFMADKGYFSLQDDEVKEDLDLAYVGAHANMSKEELAEVEARIRRAYGQHLTDNQVAKVIAIEHTPAHSRAHYRVAAIRAITGGKRVRTSSKRSSMNSLMGRVSSLAATTSDKISKSKTRKVAPGPGPEDVLPGKLPIVDLAEQEMEQDINNKSAIEFAALSYAVLENAGTREVAVVRTGNLEETAWVSYCTREGTAKAIEDYIHAEGTLTFEPNVGEMKISISIVDDNAYENDEEFYVELFNPRTDSDSRHRVELGEKSTVTVVIIDDDLPGQIAFPEDHIHVQEASNDRVVDLVVSRRNGCSGQVGCRYYSEDDSAKGGIDYEPLEGTLTFATGQVANTIPCIIKGSGRYERKEMFRVILTDVEGGATFDPKTDGGAGSCILSVFIECEGREAKARIDRIWRKLSRKWEKSRIGHSNFREQFLQALYVNGKHPVRDDPDDQDGGSVGRVITGQSFAEAATEFESQPTAFDWLMHIITLPWKLLFAFVPPTDYCGGWLCFVCSLLMIALVTAVIGDMAGLLGCVLRIEDEITAITFVALGTSLPDTFASKSAAEQDSNADASIGNVTGSNSVNVFLGLGITWTMGSLYWACRDPSAEWNSKFGPGSSVQIPARFRTGAFVVEAGTLGFSVAVFTCCALAAMSMLYVRRKVVGGELGGPRHYKIISAAFLVMLWVLYVSLVSWYAYGSCA